MIRITGGKYRGRTLKPSSDNSELRPTTSFFREWLFNVLNNMVDLHSVNVLDLFSGSGIMGFEFLSRGAENVTFVEKSRKTVRGIESFLELIGEGNYSIFQTDVIRFLTRSANLGKFDIIFLDPPYNSDLTEDVFKVLEKNIDSLNENTLVICETFWNENIRSDFFTLLKEKKSGTTKISIFGKEIQ